MSASPESRATPPRIAGRYEILHRLASGGMGSVYLASARGAGGFERLVAAKVLHPHLAHEADFVSMFLDEARLAARIRHPNVVATIDVLGAPELVIIMELVEGAHLGVLVRSAKASGGRIPLGVSVRIALDALEGLAVAHELCDDRGRLLGLVHRDVSPQNILVGTDGISRLTDFGVARAEARLTQTREGQLKGKLGYMAPELAMGATPDRRADLFSMGVVLWECLAGRRLFAGDSDAEIVTRVSTLPIPPLASLAPELAPLDAVLSIALARDPADRFASARAMARALEEAAPVVSSARTVGEVVTMLAPDAIALMRPTADGDRDRSHETTFTSIPERADEITRPVTTAARSRLLRRSPPPGPRRGVALGALGASAVLAIVGIAAAVSWGAPDIDARAAVDARIVSSIPDREPVLRSGEPPNAAPGATFVPTIELRLRVGADGAVAEAVVSNPRADLRDSELRAVEAARTWRFDPAIHDGRPVEAWVRWAMELGRADSVEGFVRIKGSDTLGGSLLPELARAYRADRPGMRVDIEALGSSTGFVGLFDGSADIAASSRRIRAEELLEAERLGVVVHELLIGWDGIAVVVHPASTIERITIEDLRAIYDGRRTDLASLGGPPGTVHAITRPPESGTFSFFSEHVLGGVQLSADTITIEHSGEIVRHVGSDPLALAYVGVSWVTPDVRVVPVVVDEDGRAVLPEREAIEQGRYPLARPLLLYVRDRPTAAVIEVLRFVFSAAGRASIAEHGFVAVERAPAALAAMEAGSGDERRAPLRLEHREGEAALHGASRAALSEWVSTLPPGARVAVRGHAGDDELDAEVLSEARAQAVGAELESLGIARERIDTRALGATQPIGPLGTEARRRLGRRTDVYLVRAR